ncbi:hypothetical protein QBC43DRAFT_328225 [Cladorrhinum sp. PSN259]|nr:hypothetical protein QBC43DRAFT_328225 [Cladorrhinum sp. PSN259]
MSNGGWRKHWELYNWVRMGFYFLFFILFRYLGGIISLTWTVHIFFFFFFPQFLFGFDWIGLALGESFHLHLLLFISSLFFLFFFSLRISLCFYSRGFLQYTHSFMLHLFALL